MQVFVRTRVPKALPQGRTPRTNVLSLVDKAEKQACGINLRELYDRLSDMVHPSIGSHETFMAQLYTKDVEGTGEDFHVQVASDARHLHDLISHGKDLLQGEPTVDSPSQEVESIIRQGAIWALEEMTTKLPQQRLHLDDMYQTVKLGGLGADYFGDETYRDIGYDPSKIVGYRMDDSGDMWMDVLAGPTED